MADPVREDRLRVAARALLACGVGNLNGDKYRRRVEAFDALDDALEAEARQPTGRDADAEWELKPWPDYFALLVTGQKALRILKAEGHTHLEHKDSCKKMAGGGFGLGGGSRSGYPCTCGKAARQAIVDAALAALAPSEPTDG